MFRDYPDSSPRITSALHTFFVKLRDEKFTNITAHKREGACDDDSGELIYPVMVMKRAPRAAV